MYVRIKILTWQSYVDTHVRMLAMYYLLFMFLTDPAKRFHKAQEALTVNFIYVGSMYACLGN